MYRLTGLALTAIAAGLFAAGPVLAQTGTGSQSGSSQRDRTGSQSGATSGQSGAAGQTDRSGSAARSDQSASATGSQTGQMASAERQFLQKAAQGSMAEIELGKLAQERGQSDEVKQLGQNLVQDHSKALDEVRQIAQSKNVTLSEELDSKHRKTKERLSKLSGEEFDRAFLKEVHREHERDIAEFRKQSQRAKDEEVKDFATRTLPALEQHRQMAMQHMGGSAAPRTDEDPSGAGKTRERDKPKSDSPGGTAGGGTPTPR